MTCSGIFYPVYLFILKTWNGKLKTFITQSFLPTQGYGEITHEIAKANNSRIFSKMTTQQIRPPAQRRASGAPKKNVGRKGGKRGSTTSRRLLAMLSYLRGKQKHKRILNKQGLWNTLKITSDILFNTVVRFEVFLRPSY